MAIVRVLPEEWETDQPWRPVYVDSDAETNAKAIVEVQAWCRQHGLDRARENYLRTLRTEGGVLVRRAICYRPSRDMEEGAAEDFARIRRNVATMPETAPVEED